MLVIIEMSYKLLANEYVCVCVFDFCAKGRLNGMSDLQRLWGETKDETPFVCVRVYVYLCVYMCEHDRPD